MSKGLLLVISGPSGAGKGTICSEYMKTHENTMLSISATTRKPRCGEIDGVHYFFLTNEEFDKMLAEDGFIEWAEYGNNRYGTPKAPVMRAMEQGLDVILEIEVVGAMQVKKHYDDGVYIFVVPPSIDILHKRLEGRNTETKQQVAMRLEKAAYELSQIEKYDYIIVNDDLKTAVEELHHMVRAEKSRTKRRWTELKRQFSI